MLIRFAIENYLSIKARQELSLVAATLRGDSTDLIEAVGIRLVPGVLIYGANASGKSNIISAFEFLKHTIKYSHQRGSPKSGVPRTAFLLDEHSKNLPTSVDIDFLLDGVRYHYGFSANDEAFKEEWLYAFPSGKRQLWFYREPAKGSISFGKNLKGPLRTIETLTRANSLFLSTAAQNAHKQLTPIFNYFGNIAFKSTIENRDFQANATYADGEFDRRILQFLAQADTGITGYRFEDKLSERNIDPKDFVKDIFGLLKKYAPDMPELPADKMNLRFLSLGHSIGSGESQFLNLKAESAGTLRLLVLLKAVFDALDSGSTLMIDELDASLHTYLAEKLVLLFNSRATNPKGAQLIATTHDTNLLRPQVVRRDQVWFTEKDKEGATTLYPLTDIRTRNGDNLEKGYLEGRFGAVPFRGPIELLVGSD